MDSQQKVPAVLFGVERAPEDTITERRESAKTIARLLKFSMDRSYLNLPSRELFAHMVARPSEGGGTATSWLRIDSVGDGASKNGITAIDAMRVAIASCHRPGSARLFFLVNGSPEGNDVYIGIRSFGSADPDELANSTKAFLESAWPGTQLSACGRSPQIEASAEQVMNSLGGGKYAMTGVPVPLHAEGSAGLGLECLINGLRGRRFVYLIIADPVADLIQDHVTSTLRDLMGALHVLAKFTSTRTSTVGTNVGQTVTSGESRSVQTQKSQSESGPVHSRLKEALGMVALGGATLAPLFPPALFVAGFAAVASAGLSDDRTRTISTGISNTDTVSVSTAESRSVSFTDSSAIAEEYVSVHVQDVLKQLEGFLNRFDRQNMWEVGGYLFADLEEGTHDACAQVAALMNGPSLKGEEPVRFVNLSSVWKKGVGADVVAGRRPKFQMVTNERNPISHPLGPTFDGLSTPMTSDELGLLMSLPRREVNGVRVRTAGGDFGCNPPTVTEPSIEIGKVLLGDDPIGRSKSVSIRSLTKHILITGTVGSGKSNTVMHLLTQLATANKPFLVIEPAKTEYLSWAREFNRSLPDGSDKKIAIFYPGESCSDNQQPLKLNPFFFPSGSSLHTHIERLRALLVGAMPMQESLPMLLESVLLELYDHTGWFDTTKVERGAAHYPIASQLLVGSKSATGSLIERVVREKRYDERTEKTFIGAMTTRIGSLCDPRSWKSRTFDVETSTPPEVLFDRPAIVNLSNLHSERAFTAGLLLSYLHEWRQLKHGDMDGTMMDGLKHLLALEEAHCLLEPARHVAAESADPKGTLSAMCAEMMSEMRAWGQGFALIDQFPTRLISDAIKNTSLKIIHRLPSRDDQDIVRAAMSLDEGQARIIPYLRTGQAIVTGDDDDAPIRIYVPRRELGGI